MALRRGFKAEANSLAQEIRAELGLSPFERLDPHVLAAHLDIPIQDLTMLGATAPEVMHLHTVEPEAFSAVTVFHGRARLIVHNDGHSFGRQNSNLSHELAHGLLLHPPTAALDDKGCRAWNQDLEDEAAFLGGVLLVTEAATLAIAKGRWTIASAAEHFGTSERMIKYRMNETGAVRRIARARAHL